ncbi:hypothetical protein E3E12_07720 [Formicincola oecophyllae]|uniref:Uncharacterized protein n=1 Tax=Formicincola oecophyllae TaxID=2558361 RepID=A0A4Y6U9D9_9PROT|nr:hypothetical protein [Formicincola oecophyllae]QDH14083.1 hypothetical protein E3E12_07720 [Formicincola oecophyllae]
MTNHTSQPVIIPPRQPAPRATKRTAQGGTFGFVVLSAKGQRHEGTTQGELAQALGLGLPELPRLVRGMVAESATAHLYWLDMPRLAKMTGHALRGPWQTPHQRWELRKPPTQT